MSSTRTDELKDAVILQARLSAGLGARTDFHHLNNPRSGTPRCVTLTTGNDTSSCARAGAFATTTNAAIEMLTQAIVPCGSTPLTSAVNEVHHLLAPVAEGMRHRGERAVVVIATDGLPDHPHDFCHALQLLQSRCPVWIIVRLCTSDATIVDYWSELDKQLERPLEVLDDVFGEAREVSKYNDWLAYAPQLHAARLFGLHHKLFDMLDETELPPFAIKQFCEMLLGCPPLPEPQLEPELFIQTLREVVTPLPLVYDPRLQRMRPWVDVDRLAAKLRSIELLRRLGLPPSLNACLRCCV